MQQVLTRFSLASLAAIFLVLGGSASAQDKVYTEFDNGKFPKGYSTNFQVRLNVDGDGKWELERPQKGITLRNANHGAKGGVSVFNFTVSEDGRYTVGLIYKEGGQEKRKWKISLYVD